MLAACCPFPTIKGCFRNACVCCLPQAACCLLFALLVSVASFVQFCVCEDSRAHRDRRTAWKIPKPVSEILPGRVDARDAVRVAVGRDRRRLAEVERRCPDDRRARYVCVVTLARPGRETVSVRGETSGVLVAPSGSGGFGYDPAFLSDDLGITFGEATAEAKDGVSHRARALAALLVALDAEGD